VATLWTLGHSDRPWDAFAALVRAWAIGCIADVRAYPTSRRHPHFAREALEAGLRGLGVRYAHLPELGGRRRGLGPASPNTAWRDPGLRAYADHLATPEFARGLERLLALAEGQAVAVLCAEAVPWRCHRWLLADALVARGHAVHHILSPTRAVPHALHPGTEVRDGVPTYPARDAPGWVAGEGP
jgi:uncharacterized protein (DUF488 family)